MKAAIFSLSIAIGLGSCAGAQASTLEVNGLTFGMSIDQAIQALGPGYKVGRARRNDGIEQIVVFKQDIGYAFLAMGGKIYYIAYDQAFPKGEELNKAKVESDLDARFGQADGTWAHFGTIQWAYDANEQNTPPTRGNVGCSGAQGPAFPSGAPPELNRVTNLSLPTTMGVNGQTCALMVRAGAVTDHENPALIQELYITMFDRRPAMARYREGQAAGQQQRDADAKAAQGRKSPF